MPEEGDFYTLNLDYNRDETVRENLKSDVKKLFPSLQFLQNDSVKNHDFHTIFTSSYLTDPAKSFIDSLKTKEIILVEDGTFDYDPKMTEYPFYQGKNLYLFRPKLASPAARTSAKALKTLNPNQKLLEKSQNLYEADKFRIVEVPQNIPGQFIDRLFTGPKIYLAKSTVGFMGNSPEIML